ncbi:MAG: 50S ribosomal protein L18Ae [Candidatus Thorarchaeota archaeon]
MSKEIQVKNFRVTFLKKPLIKDEKYEVEVRALNETDAVNKAYARIGSKHRIDRDVLIVKAVKIIENDELKNPILREIAGRDDIKLLPRKQK